MSEFINTRASLQQKREECNQSRSDWYTQKELFRLQQLKIQHRLRQERVANLPASDADQQLLLNYQKTTEEKQLVFDQLTSEVQSIEKEFDALGTPQTVIANLNDELPILLMPLRVQTRFLTVRHLATGLSREHFINVSREESNDFLENLPSQWEKKKAAGELLEIPTLFSISSSKNAKDRNWANGIGSKIKKKQITTLDNNWLKAIPDASELWVRIYPDDIFVHSHEPHLTPQEMVAGKTFWKRWWEIHLVNPDALQEERTGSKPEKPLTAAWASLQNAYRAARAAWIFRQTMPSNYAGSETDYQQAPVFDPTNVSLKSESWTEPVLSFVMPDQFVVKLFQGKVEKEFTANRIPHPLKLMPAPEPEATLEEVKWAMDFEAAEKMGLAIRINLPDNGFKTTEKIDKLVVLGVKTSTDENNGKILLETLFENHHYKGSGMSILPQGTATNNFEQTRSGYSSDGLRAEETFKIEAGDPLFSIQSDWKNKKDGQYLCEALGMQSSLFEHVQHSDGSDIMGALAMNRLLWPATMGYYLQQFFQSSLQRADIENTKAFFLNHVSGRGFLPVIRVDKQPYGIMPATAFSKWAFQDTDNPFLANLFNKVLQPLDAYWSTLSKKVKQLSDPALELHKYSEEFVRILGLCPSSKVFYQRPQVGKLLLENAIGADLNEKPVNPPNPIGGWEYNANDPVRDKMRTDAAPFFRKDLLKELRHLNLKLEGSSTNRIMEQHFSNLYHDYRGSIIDNLPSSEKRQLSKWKDKDLNYLQWLQQSTYKMLQGDHFSNEPSDPSQSDALLYLIARQALSRTYLETAVSLIPDLKKEISLIDFELEQLSESPLTNFGEEQLRFLNIFLTFPVTNNFNDFLYKKNKWSYLDVKTPETGDKTIGEFLEEHGGSFSQLSDAKSALTHLQNLSTASLERLFSEHLDVCSYRLDSWMYGLVNQRLEKQRKENPQGIYLGAYGYLENLDPSKVADKVIFRVVESPEIIASPATVDTGKVVVPLLNYKAFVDSKLNLDELLSQAFIYLGFSEQVKFIRSADDSQKIVTTPSFDSNNQGFIHAPGQAHAITAAILRSGYLANNPKKEHDDFAINLSSVRVRKALYLIEGIRNGQELPALLGYQFERHLHDHKLDKYIASFRKAFPIHSKIDTSDTGTVEELEASNVVHGLNLLNLYREKENDLDKLLEVKAKYISVSASEEKNQIKAAITQLNQNLDAVSDLLVAESVFQTAKGDINRSAAVMKMLNNDQEIEIPEIVNTPKKGKLLSHLVGVQFDLSKKEVAWPGVHSHRSTLQPALNHWLASQLPNPKTIRINLSINGELQKLQLENIGIQPIDLITFFQGKDAFVPTSELTYFITKVAWKFFNAGPLDEIKVLYQDSTNLPTTYKTLYEIKPLIEHLLKILANSRPMLPHDLQLSSQAQPLDSESFSSLDIQSLLDRFRTVLEGSSAFSFYKTKNNLNGWHYECRKSRAADFPEDKAQFNYEVLQRLLFETAYFGSVNQDYQIGLAYSPERRELLLQKAEQAITYFENLELKVKAHFASIEAMENPDEVWKSLCILTEMIFGSTLKLFPEFRLHNSVEITSAIDFPDLLVESGENAQQEWLQGLALVRPQMKNYKKLTLFREIFHATTKDKDLKIIQLPYQTDTQNYRWLGAEFPSRIKVSGDVKSLALELPKNYKPDQLQAGIILDSWTERIQEKERDTAIALHYDQANAEPPQTLLLAVAPNITGSWKWEDLMLTVVETIEMAKKRAVEPALLDEDEAARPDGVHYMPGHPLKFILPALSIPVSNTVNTPAVKFNQNARNF